MVRLLSLLGLFAALGAAVPLEERQAGALPQLKLPYGTWQASKIDAASDVVIFKNIRFGETTAGENRFAKPVPPKENSTLQTGTYGPSCMTGNLGGALGGAVGGLLATAAAASEDCLFLDVYVPRKALENASQSKLPVVVWIYGGAYILGSKDQVGAVPVIQATKGNAIFVSGNYRLGPYGWLAGTTMEQQGTPNAALYDQRAVFQWVQDHISLVGGDPSNVSAWGESAGAGSILQHLSAFGGKQDPLFRKAVILSPAFEMEPDREGMLENRYKVLEKAAGCEGQGVACLRKVPSSKIAEGQGAVVNAGAPGSFGFGPAGDGSWTRQMPVLEFKSGNYWKDMDSLIISHMANEAELFISGDIKTEDNWKNYLDLLFNASTVIKDAVQERYGPIQDMHQRMNAFVGESSFYCNVRNIADAYPGKSYVVKFSRGVGLHGGDVTAVFYSPGGGGGATALLGGLFGGGNDPKFDSFAQGYQSYLASHIQTGDPNKMVLKGGDPATIEWPLADSSSKDEGKVLEAGKDGFAVITDNQLNSDSCQFWQDVMAGSTNQEGVAPPGGVVPSPFSEDSNEESKATAKYDALKSKQQTS